MSPQRVPEPPPAGPGEEDHLLLGRLGKPRGNRGEVYFLAETDFPERLAEPRDVLLEMPGRGKVPARLEGVYSVSGRLVARFQGVRGIGEAEALRGSLVLLPESEARPLPPGQYYHHQLIGLQVLTEGGELLGAVTGVLRTAAGDLLEIAGGLESAEGYLIPAVEEICYDVRPAEGILRVRPPQGLLEINRGENPPADGDDESR